MADANRCDMLPAVARGMGMDMSSDRTLWKDRALVELTEAVMHSFDRAGVSIVDHHFATKQFVRHEQREEQAGRATHANWELIVPANRRPGDTGLAMPLSAHDRPPELLPAARAVELGGMAGGIVPSPAELPTLPV